MSSPKRDSEIDPDGQTNKSSNPIIEKGKPLVSDSFRKKVQISSIEDLQKYESEILDRIRKIPNGPNLFMIHPFMMLSDVDVELSDDVIKKLVEIEPHLSALSVIPYEILKKSNAKQSVTYTLRGLFPREKLA